MSQMRDEKYIIVLVTAKNRGEAENITSKILNKRLAACVNIIDNIKSYFRWKGKIEVEKEALMIIKTRSKAFKKLESAVKTAHSYSVPEIIGVHIIKGQKGYLDWIKESVNA